MNLKLTALRLTFLHELRTQQTRKLHNFLYWFRKTSSTLVNLINLWILPNVKKSATHSIFSRTSNCKKKRRLSQGRFNLLRGSKNCKKQPPTLPVSMDQCWYCKYSTKFILFILFILQASYPRVGNESESKCASIESKCASSFTQK